MARPKRDRWHLMDIAYDLAYEWWMAAEAANRLDTLRVDENKRWETNTAFEAFLVHGRNLRDFFLGSFNPDDVIVEDFLGSSISVEIRKLNSAVIDIWIAKRVLHLSHSRLTLPREWRHRHLMEEIDGAMRSFVAALRATDPELADLVAAQRNTVPQNGVVDRPERPLPSRTLHARATSPLWRNLRFWR